MSTKGKLYLIPTGIGDNSIDKIMPQSNQTLIHKIDEFIVEEIGTARSFLKRIEYPKPFDGIIFNILNEHTRISESASYLDSALVGKDIGLLSEAGLPCIADPGADIVKTAHRKNIQVIPLIGPSSLLLALMASGFNGQNFAFLGYLPIESHVRSKRIKEIEKDIYSKNQTQLFIEAPYRNMQLFEALLQSCFDDTMLCVACDLTLPTQYICSKPIHEWKRIKPTLHKRPCVFLLYK